MTGTGIKPGSRSITDGDRAGTKSRPNSGGVGDLNCERGQGGIKSDRGGLNAERVVGGVNSGL